MSKFNAVLELLEIARQVEGPDGDDWQRLRIAMEALGLDGQEVYAVFVRQGWA